jgi:2,4-dienoyl-CoA reductase-like NADH-dependent reductase (Old Yellow Enzyme family)
MTRPPDPLFQPISFRSGAVAPNRLALAPMTNSQSHDDGALGDDELAWLARRADGGFGMIATCAAFVAMDGKGFAGQLGVHDDAMLPGMTRLAERIQVGGGLGIVQLYHGGVRASKAFTGEQPWSATVFTDPSPRFEVPRAATADDIERVLAQFTAAAVRSHRAGFAGIELHGAHGYLLSQFLSRTMNTRSDGWGGDLVGRARLLREAARRIRAAVPAPFLVGVRISPEDFGYARGLDLDESLQIAQWLCEDGIDFLHLSLWNVHHNTKKRPEAHPLPLFRAVVPAAVRLLVAGEIWTRDEAETVLAQGGDVAALGRSAILNPDWPRLAADPAWAPVRPPMTRADLAARGVGPTFADYLTRWKGFVADT